MWPRVRNTGYPKPPVWRENFSKNDFFFPSLIDPDTYVKPRAAGGRWRPRRTRQRRSSDAAVPHWAERHLSGRFFLWFTYSKPFFCAFVYFLPQQTFGKALKQQLVLIFTLNNSKVQGIFLRGDVFFFCTLAMLVPCALKKVRQAFFVMYL